MFDIQAKQFARGAGRHMQIGRMTAYSQITSDDTQGAYTLMEALVPPNSGSGLHRHWSYDEAVLVLGGKFECHSDGKLVTLGEGESVYWPRGAVHNFRSVGPDDGRILFLCSPGKIFEDFIEQISASRVDGGNAVSGPAVDFRALASKFGIEMLD